MRIILITATFLLPISAGRTVRAIAKTKASHWPKS